MIHLVIVVCLVATWCARYCWRRRRLYECARQRRGPLALPFVGNVIYLAGRSRDIFDKVFKFIAVFESPAPLWLGPHLFFVIWDSKNLKTVLNNQDCLEKSVFYKYVEDAIGRGLITHPVDKWKRHRKLIAPIFNRKTLESFVEVFYTRSQTLTDQLIRSVSDDEVDVFGVFSSFAACVLMETGLGVVSEAYANDQCSFLNIAKDVAYVRMNNVSYHFDCIFRLTSHAKKLDEAVNQIEIVIGGAVKKCLLMKEVPDHPTFLQKLIEASRDEQEFTETDLRDEITTFLIGGNDTVTTTLSYVTTVLGMYPTVQEQIYSEVASTIGLTQPISYADLCGLEYTERAIKETLRLFPPAPCVSRKVLKDIRLENCIIPAGSSIAIAIMGLHRDPKVWPNPLEFDPDRFHRENEMDPYNWLPFSGGSRNCVAQRYAITLMKVVVASLVRRYRFSSSYKDVGAIKFEANLLLKPIDGFKVSVALRQ